MEVKISCENMITKLYVFGKNGLSIENFPTDKFHKYGNNYIECYDHFREEGYSEEHIGKGMTLLESVFRDDECEEFHQLYTKAIEYLLKHCEPKITVY